MRILSNKKLLPLLLTYFIDSLGVGIVLPFLVVVVNRLGGNAVIYGVVGSIYPATQLIGSAVLGSWSDRFGRKAILFVSEIGTMLGWVVFLIALLLPRTEIATISSPLLGTFMLTVPLVFVIMSRAIDGLTGGNYVVAEAYIADVTSETERTASYGLMTVMGNLGFTVGPALAGLLGGTALAEKLPIVVAIVLSAATTLIIAVVLPESHKKTVVSAEGSGSGHKVGRRVILENKGIVFVLMLYFAMFIGFNIYYTAFPIHAIRKLGWHLFRCVVLHDDVRGGAGPFAGQQALFGMPVDRNRLALAGHKFCVAGHEPTWPDVRRAAVLRVRQRRHVAVDAVVALSSGRGRDSGIGTGRGGLTRQCSQHHRPARGRHLVRPDRNGVVPDIGHDIRHRRRGIGPVGQVGGRVPDDRGLG
jgi:MFS family permease